MVCYFEAVIFFGCNKFCGTVVHQNFAILFAEYHVIMGILCDCMCHTRSIGCLTFDIEAAALQNFYCYYACSNHFFCFYNVFRFDVRADFHSVARFGQQCPQCTCQFDTICTCVRDLHAICVFENVGTDNHIQFFCRILQIFAGSGNRQCDSNGFCTAHTGFHFGFDCIYYYIHIHNSSSYILYIRKNENFYLI